MTVTVPPGTESEAFARLTEPLRAELLAHCYRMLGSVHDAEDQVQETMLRAWRSFGAFEGRSSVRTWLYRIATNACLRALENRSRRPLPAGLGAPSADPDAPLAGAQPEGAWLEPFPDARAPAADPADPASIAAARADTRLALIAALQLLPPRQRAVLLLRDVLGWRAAEVAGLLDASPAAVNSLLQRAREQLRQAGLVPEQVTEPPGAADRDLVSRYAAAFAASDVAGLTRLLADDAVFEMPPQPGWFRGREAIGVFLAGRVLTRPGRFLLVPAGVNGQPGFGLYLRGPRGAYRAHGIQALTLASGQVARITAFRDPALFPFFGLPARPPGRDSRPRALAGPEAGEE
jgi:RNA polymerase sigma-70 factor (ECF subfamily)